MFRKLFQWAKSLFASESKYEAQTTATENEVQNPASTPKSASSLAPSDWERIEQAMEQDLPLTCQVLACKKGGYTVSVLDTYAFLPNTLTHYYRSNTPDRVLGKQLKVHVRSVKNTQIMVSHKEFLDEAYSKLAIGDVCDAVVAKILDGRLLVYLPDSELYATVSMSELSWSLEDTIADFCPGQQVRVRITKKGGLEKIRASIRQAEEANPYEKCINDYHEGDVLQGVIINVLDFGAFVKLSEGVSGLLHRSEVRWDEPAPNMKDIFKFGDRVKVVLCRIDHEQGRLFLSIKRLDTTKLSDVYKAGSIHSARVKLVTDKFVTLDLPYEVKAQVRMLRFAKAGVMPKEGDEVEVQVMTYTPETNNIKVALRLEQAA